MNPKKIEQVTRLKEMLQTYPFAMAINYSGMKVIDSRNLRARIRTSNANMYVARNTLMAIAADEVDRKEIKDILGGQLAFIFSDLENAPACAKALLGGIKDLGLEIEVVGGIMNKSVLTAAEIKQLSSLPSREILLGQLLGLLNGGVRNLAGVLYGTVASLAIALNAVAAKNEQTEKTETE